ncbi:hypothetical protein CSOJ01_06837 [Colletotrichum sojae]|uniref:Uncharacterized protein n=1 Tax=Colletotrichum sojae TaxID=2175907 RepID=A0A8H6JBC6_9PEZI|nr:hypothetical protein CSOJ01_06837 [Colletotrichum sojae]
MLIAILVIVWIVLIFLAVLPTLYLFVRIIRKPGYRLDDTRRWVDYTKGGLGLWLAAQVIQIVLFIVIVADGASTFDVNFDSVGRRVVDSLVVVARTFSTWAEVCVCLAFFYLSHALTRLRNPLGQEDSSKYRKGRVWAWIGAALVAGLTLLSFALWLSTSVTGHSRSRSTRRLVASCFDLTCFAILIVFAIANIVYSAKSRKKALGSPVHKAANILVTCTSLWFVRMVWSIASTFLGGFHVVVTFLDIFVSVWLGLAILYMLCRLASKESYALSRASYGSVGVGKTGDAEQQAI